MNIPHRATFEPTNNPVGTLIRDILSRKTAVRPATLAHLYVSDRHEHLHAAGGILDTAGRGMLAVSDRYLFSSLAYQSIDCGFDYVLRINGIFPLPELLIFIDLEPAICQQRLAERGKAELFDDIQFQQKVRKSYQETFSYFAPTDMQIETVDGTLPPERVHEKIWEFSASCR